jgi:hypothetical protein
MEDQTRENLNDLLRQFLDPARVEAATEDIRTGERILDIHPAPAPSPEAIARIKNEFVARVARRHRIILTIRRSLAAAAVIAFARLRKTTDRRPRSCLPPFGIALTWPRTTSTLCVSRPRSARSRRSSRLWRPARTSLAATATWRKLRRN